LTSAELGRYEPPRIEARLSGTELEREVLYAGATSNPSPG
jgi:hypothetical protein